MTPDAVIAFIKDNPTDINLLCFAANNIKDHQQSNGSYTQKAEDFVIEEFMLINELTMKEGSKLFEAFGTNTGCNKAIIAWAKKHGVSSENEAIVLAKNICPADRYGPEAVNTLACAIEKSGVKITGKPTIENRACMCLTCQTARLALNDREEYLLIAELSKLSYDFLEEMATLNNKEYKKFLKEFNPSPQLREILEKVEKPNINESCLCSRGADVFADDIETLDQLLSNASKRGELNQVRCHWRGEMLPLDELIEQDNLPDALREILQKYM